MTLSSPLLCAAGDVHGHLDQLYAELLAFEAGIGERFAHVLQVGDLGVWPDPGCLDAATRRHEGPGDFHAWWAERRPVPRPTTFIHGIHEDFRFLGALEGPEVLPGLHYLRGGESVVLPGGARVAGIGGSYGASHYRRVRQSRTGRSLRHYTEEQVERVQAMGHVDILLLHQAPAGVSLPRRIPGVGVGRYPSRDPGLADALVGCQPAVCFFGRHHHACDTVVRGIRCIGLDVVGRRGSLVAFRVAEGQVRVEAVR